MATSWVRSRFIESLIRLFRRQPGGRALVEEALDALAAFGAGADVGDAACRVGAQLGVDLAAGDVADELLAGARRHRAVGDDRGREAGDRLVDRRCRAHLVREPARPGLGRAEALGGDEVAARRLLA